MCWGSPKTILYIARASCSNATAPDGTPQLLQYKPAVLGAADTRILECGIGQTCDPTGAALVHNRSTLQLGSQICSTV